MKRQNHIFILIVDLNYQHVCCPDVFCLCHISLNQVKNFGRSGRTKYTHLVDQDTTSFDSAWAQESAQNTKFFKQKAAGVRDVFDRPTVKKRKT